MSNPKLFLKKSLHVLAGIAWLCLTSTALANQSATFLAGNNITISVTANGTAPFTYQWSKNGSPVSGKTLATYDITNAQSSDAGTYSVVVTNSAGATTSDSAILTFATSNIAPSFTTQPQASQTALTGDTITFTVAASGTPAPT